MSYYDSYILADQQRPRISSPNAGGGGDCGVSANEYSCTHHVTWSPNKLWRSNSIVNLWAMKTIRTMKRTYIYEGIQQPFRRPSW
jgi:hypothetical protein